MIRYLFPLVGCTLLIIYLGRMYSDSLRLDPLKNPHVQDMCREFDSYIQRQMVETQTPGAAIVIIKDTSVIYMKGLGQKQAGKVDSVDVHTAFRIGSLSKGFAAVLAAMLVKDHLLEWDEKVVSFLPYFRLYSPQQTQQLTIRHILSQRTGLPRHAFTNLIEQRIKMERVYRELKGVKLVGNVGKLYSYQNATYSMIADIAEIASCQPFSHLLHDRIFTPLYMEQASCSFQGMITNPNIAYPHFPTRKETWKRTRLHNKYYNAIPAGGINASISDMAQWLQLLLGNRPDLITSRELDAVFQPYIQTDNRNRYFHRWPYLKEAHYAMGWRVVVDGQDTLQYHGGYVNGFRSEIALSRSHKMAICVLSNAPSELAPQAIPVFWDIFRIQKKAINAYEKKRHWAFSLDRPGQRQHMLLGMTRKLPFW